MQVSPPTIQDYSYIEERATLKGGKRAHNECKRMSSPEKPLISIITTVRNGSATIEKTIQSILHQTYDNIEYILIDSNSTDGTLDIIRKYEVHIDLWISEGDKGIYDGMNKGIALARGNLIAILNADDHYELNAIEKIVELAKQSPSAGVIHFNRNSIFVGDCKVPVRSNPNPNITDFCTMPLSHEGMFVRRETYLQHGLYKLKYRLAADHEFSLRLRKAGVEFAHLDEYLLNMLMGGASTANGLGGPREIGIVLKDHKASWWTRCLHKIFLWKYIIVDGLQGSKALRFYREMKYDI